MEEQNTTQDPRRRVRQTDSASSLSTASPGPAGSEPTPTEHAVTASSSEGTVALSGSHDAHSNEDEIHSTDALAPTSDTNAATLDNTAAMGESSSVENGADIDSAASIDSSALVVVSKSVHWSDDVSSEASMAHVDAESIVVNVKSEPMDDGALYTPTTHDDEDEEEYVPTPANTRSARPVASDSNGAPSASSAVLSRVAQLTKRIELDPLDGEARLALIGDAESKGDLERTREVYEDFLSVFPDASAQWIAYATLELSHSHFALVEALFARCLLPSPSVALWKFYLDYIRRVNPIDDSASDGSDARAVIAKSFEFALVHVGMDREAGEIWKEYIGFLRSTENRGTWEDQQRTDVLRKTYQRAICIPLNSVESIWQEYNQFESGLNKMTAKKYVAELSPSYMTARKVLRELRAQYDTLPAPAIPQRPNFNSSRDREALEFWKRYIDYEKSNPLDLEDEADLQARVTFTFKKALGALRFYSEVWFLTSIYNTSIGKVEDSAANLRSGLVANPASMLLAYTLAEHEESTNDFPACYAIYESLLAHFQSKLVTITAFIETETAIAIAAIDAGGAEIDAKMEDSEDVESRQKIIAAKEEATELIKKNHQSELDSGKSAAANVWITQMRFARRAEGIKQARSVFTKARKSPYLAWQVVEASATMELYWNKDPKIATNVFELGLKSFGSDAEYVMQYLDFLIKSNNDSNARALFERTITKIAPAQARPLWDRWAQYEYQYGDFLSAQKLFQRYSEAFPDISPIERFAERHAYLGLDDAISRDLGTSVASTSAHDHKSSGSRKRASSPDLDDHQLGQTDRAMSLERGTYNGRDGSGRGLEDPGSKRLKSFHRDSASPGPSALPSQIQGQASSWGRSPLAAPIGGVDGAKDDYDYSRSGRRRPLDNTAVTREVPHQLDARGEVVAVLPPAIVFFLSILPAASSFHGPMLNPATIVDVIVSTILPGSVGGQVFEGERLGVPPRSQGPTRGGGGGQYREPTARPPPAAHDPYGGGGYAQGGQAQGPTGYSRY